MLVFFLRVLPFFFLSACSPSINQTLPSISDPVLGGSSLLLPTNGNSWILNWDLASPDSFPSAQDASPAAFSLTTNGPGKLRSWNTPHFSDLVGYWPLDTLTHNQSTLPGTNATGNAVDGSILSLGTSGPETPEGIVQSQAFTFKGDSSLFIPLPELASQTEFTFSVWVQTNQANTTFLAVTSQPGAPDGLGDRILYFNSGYLCYKIVGDGFRAQNEYYTEQQCSDTTYTDNQWHHVVLTFAPNSVAPRLYIDGLPTGPFNGLGYLSFSSYNRLTSLKPPFQPAGIQLGSVPAGNTVTVPFSNTFFSGRLSELAVFSKSFTSGDVLALYHHQKKPPAQTGENTSSVLSFPNSSSLGGVLWETLMPFGKDLVTSGVERGYSSSLPDFSQNLSGFWNFHEGFQIDPNSLTSNNPTFPAAGPYSFSDQSVNGHSALLDLGSGYIDYNSLRDPSTGVSYFLAFNRVFLTNPSLGVGKTLGLTFLPGYEGSLKIAHHSDFELTTSFSISLWVNLAWKNIVFPATGQSRFSYVLATKTTLAGVPSPFYWDVDPLGKMRLLLGDGSSVLGSFTSTQSVPSEEWVHLAVTYDDSLKKVQFYVNGTSEASQTLTGSLADPTQRPIQLGQQDFTHIPSGNFSYPTQYLASFAGSLDSFGIWKNRVLSASEVAELTRRGNEGLRLQVKLCQQSDCSDGAWQEALSASQSETPTLKANTVSLGGSPKFIQYKTFAEKQTGVFSSSQLLEKVLFFGAGYDPNAPTAILNQNKTFSSLEQFSELFSPASSIGCTSYQLSPNGGSQWYYWNASGTPPQWTPTTQGLSESNSGTEVQTHLSDFSSQVGTGTLAVKVLFPPPSIGTCELLQLRVSGLP